MKTNCPLAACVALAPIAAAQIIVDPTGAGDFTQLQAGIDAAADGDVVVVRGGNYPPVVIRRSLTLLGDPRPRIGASSDGWPMAAVHIDAGTSGHVTLRNIHVQSADVDDPLGHNDHAVTGTCASLDLHDCHVQAATWIQYSYGDRVYGYQGVQIAADRILLVRTEVHASDSGIWFGLDGVAETGGHGIDAPGSRVIAIDSRVIAGNAGATLMTGNTYPSASIGGGHGGTGLICSSLLDIDSTFSGGTGTVISVSGLPDVTQPDGLPVVASSRETIAQSLVASEAPRFGQTFELRVPGTSGLSTLLLGSPLWSGVDVFGARLFIDPAQPIAILGAISSSGYLGVSVPMMTNLLGLSFGLQGGSLQPDGGVWRLYLTSPLFELVSA